VIAGRSEAKKIWEDAKDGEGVTDCERETIKYAMNKYKFTADATKSMNIYLESGKHTSFYKTIKGVKTRTWEDLTVLTCDRAAKVEIAKGLVQEGVCETEVADRLAEECSDKFLTHMDMRCDFYATLWSINIGLEYVTYAMALVGALAGVIMLVPALATSRVVVLPVVSYLQLSRQWAEIVTCLAQRQLVPIFDASWYLRILASRSGFTSSSRISLRRGPAKCL